MCIVKYHKSLLQSNFKPIGREMMKCNQLEPVMHLYEELKNKKGLLASQVLALLKMIKKNGFLELAKHVIEKYESWTHIGPEIK